jgi:lipoprotein-anchoring transpeptidase ErfK/SrfK
LGVRGAFVAAALVAVAAVLALLFWRVEDIDEPAPQTRPVGLELPPPGSLAARVKRGAHIALWNRPNGKVLRRIDDTTEFGSPEVLSPTGPRQGGWIAVRHTSLGNSGAAWVHARPATLTFRPRRVRVEVDLSRRELVVVPDGGRRRRFSVAIGAPDTPTPPGEFYVTDKLRGADYGEFYGCCILALSGRQPDLPRGWSGGDRLAIHGSPTPTWGQNVSNGCLHARTADLRYLMRTIPLGTVVTVHA